MLDQNLKKCYNYRVKRGAKVTYYYTERKNYVKQIPIPYGLTKRDLIDLLSEVPDDTQIKLLFDGDREVDPAFALFNSDGNIILI